VRWTVGRDGAAAAAAGRPYGGGSLRGLSGPRGRRRGADRAGAGGGLRWVVAGMKPVLTQGVSGELPPCRGGCCPACCSGTATPGAFAERGLAVPGKGGRDGAGWVACAISAYGTAGVAFKDRRVLPGGRKAILRLQSSDSDEVCV